LVAVFTKHVKALCDVCKRNVLLELLQLHVELDTFEVATALYAHKAEKSAGIG
jgi:hypothetical protein